jgi:glycosyltransferase involved in cell wall biosynthesis
LLRSLDFLMLTLPGVRGRLPRVMWTFHNARLDLRPDQVPVGARLLEPKRRAYRFLYHHASVRAAALIAVSSDVAASVAREFRPRRGRLVTIPNGVEVARYEGSGDRETTRQAVGIPSDALIFICVAKLYEQKGHAVLIEAFETLSRSVASAHLALVGDGPLAAELREQVRDAGLVERVHLLGERRDVPRLLAASDVFVLPSLWEGLPVALLEAMAARLPVVASRVSGTEEVLHASGEYGLLVDPADVEGLGEAMMTLATDAQMRARLGSAARQRVESAYSVEAQAQAHIVLYQRSLATPIRLAS